MSLTAYPIPTFGGLNLIDDPEEVGATQATDLLNVDLDKQGRVRSRDGYDNFLTATAAGQLDSISPFYLLDGTKQVITSTEDVGLLSAYSSVGASIATQAFGGGDCIFADFARFGGPSAELIYVASWLSLWTQTNTSYKWDGTAWALAPIRIGGAGAYPFAVEVQATENRLVAAYPAAGNSRVGFSDPGVPETIGVANFVDLTPGDGERITALVSWRELVFAFKETKFFVFTGSTVSGTGTPIFNYRSVSTNVGAIGRHAAVATPVGVFFVSPRGIYVTTGGVPSLVSRAIDPIFRGGEGPTYLGGILNHTAIDKVRISWHDERLYVLYPSGTSTTNDRMLVYSPETGIWVLWNIAANGLASFRTSTNRAELLFTYAVGDNDIGRISSTSTTDDGTAITSRYQSGFYELSPGNRATTRWTKLWGYGTPILSIFTDHASTDPLLRSATITLGTAPTVVKALHNKSYTGELFSHNLSATTSWAVNRIEHDIAETSKP